MKNSEIIDALDLVQGLKSTVEKRGNDIRSIGEDHVSQLQLRLFSVEDNSVRAEFWWYDETIFEYLTFAEMEMSDEVWDMYIAQRNHSFHHARILKLEQEHLANEALNQKNEERKREIQMAEFLRLKAELNM